MSADMFPALFPGHIFHLLVEAVMLFPVTEEKAPGMMTERTEMSKPSEPSE